MPILKVYDISTPDKVREIDMEASLKRSSNTQSEYTVDDIMLVRTTDYLPENRVIRPYSETPNALRMETTFYVVNFLKNRQKYLKLLKFIIHIIGQRFIQLKMDLYHLICMEILLIVTLSY